MKTNRMLMATHHRKLASCPNCGNPLQPNDNFCPNCGQENHDLQVPFSHLFLELFESIFHFEAKFFTTLKVIFSRPGLITRDFWEGRRARYMHPFRLYVFVSFLFFLIANKVADQTAGGISRQMQESGINRTNMVAEIADLIDSNRPSYGDSLLEARGLDQVKRVDLQLPIDKAGRFRAVRELKKADGRRLDSLLRTKNLLTTAQNRSQLRQALAFIPDSTNIPSDLLLLGAVNVHFGSVEEYRLFTQRLQTMTDPQIDSVIVSLNSQPSWLNRTLLKQVGKIRLEDETIWRDLAHAVMKNLSVIMFILMPFVALLLLLAYLRRKRYYFEHLIFSVHIHTILFIILTIALAIGYFSGAGLVQYALLIGWLYFFLSLKTVYRQGWLKTALKFLVLSVSYLVVVACFFAGALFWGFMTF